MTPSSSQDFSQLEYRHDRFFIVIFRLLCKYRGHAKGSLLKPAFHRLMAKLGQFCFLSSPVHISNNILPADHFRVASIQH